MGHCVLITVHLHDGRFHGTGDWPPAPARLFQALVAGAASGNSLSTEDSAALTWLEKLPPPEIRCPGMRRGQRIKSFVPNNDLDAVGSNPERIGEVRAGEKLIRPYVFDVKIPFLYAWRFDSGDKATQRAGEICALAERVYQFGRGVDMAWAWGEILDDSTLDSRLARHVGVSYRPTPGRHGTSLACPIPGSLEALCDRFAASSKRLSSGDNESEGVLSQAPKPRFQLIAYNSTTVRQLFELRSTTGDSPFDQHVLVDVSSLLLNIRDKAVTKLTEALPQRNAEIERVLVGRDATEADKTTRVRIVPLPSIGHHHADRSIRRVLVEVPPNCPIGADDIAWAFSGLIIEAGEVNTETGEIAGETRLVPAEERTMLRHYGVDTAERHRQWRTVTPAALPENAKRRRIDPRRVREEAKDGLERTREQNLASTAVLHALRHAGIEQPVSSIRVQREPFEGKGARTEAFAAGTRFAKERLWHVEIIFTQQVAGPLLLGDGRYLGLGLMAPVPRVEGVHSFSILEGLADRANPMAVAQALRRAVMSRVQSEIGNREKLPAFFSGHEANGKPSRGRIHAHLAFAADLEKNRLLIIAPHVLEGRQATRDERQHLETLDASVVDLSDLRAGAAGILKLARTAVDSHDDPLFGAARIWESVTDYRPTRYGKRMTPDEALIADVRTEVLRRGIAMPTDITVFELHEGPRGGLAGRLLLRFSTAVNGPILIGRTRHAGGGLFSAVK
jgi:CRISPR-associated protein Csb2